MKELASRPDSVSKLKICKVFAETVTFQFSVFKNG